MLYDTDITAIIAMVHMLYDTDITAIIDMLYDDIRVVWHGYISMIFEYHSNKEWVS